MSRRVAAAPISAQARRAVVMLALAAASAAGGCAGEGAALLTASSGPSIGAPAVASTEGAAGDEAGATTDKPAFNPFVEGTVTDRPLREVIQNPSRAEIMKAGALAEFSIGRPDAPVTIIKYMSLTCQYCRRFQAETFPVLKREYIDKGKVRLVLREFPIGKTSGTATIALRCAPMDKYLPLYEKFLAQQAQWVSQEVRPDAIFKVAQQVGMTRAQFDACLTDQKLVEALKAIKDRGRLLGIIGTPNFFVETKLIKKVVGINEIRELVDPLLTKTP